MRRVYVVRKGLGYWEFVDETKDWWTKRHAAACQFTSLYAARRVARRTGGTVQELVAVELEP